MLYQIQDRMQYLLDKNKIVDPQRICELLSEELKPIIENYLAVENDIVVRFKKQNNKNVFFVEINAERIKPFGYIPY